MLRNQENFETLAGTLPFCLVALKDVWQKNDGFHDVIGGLCL